LSEEDVEEDVVEERRFSAASTEENEIGL
jgi:hypothetical protein